MRTSKFKEEKITNKSTISKPTFEIIKKCIEINNGLTTYELSNKLLEENESKYTVKLFVDT